jgi:mRNA-degrading endonuclease RelE of RelBE toxin-antitoxin system
MPKNIRKAVQANLETLRSASDPAKLAKPLSGNLAGCHRLRVLGRLRVVFEIDVGRGIIDILRIDYRGNVYD